MLNKSLKWLAVFFVAVAAVFAALLFVPKDNGKTYRIKVEKNQGISAVSRKLAEDGVVFNRYVIVAAAYLTGAHNDLRAGSYRLPVKISAWNVLKKLRGGRPDSVTVRIAEGMRFADMRYVINDTEDIVHETRGWSNAKLMQAVAPEAADMNPEGLFFPDTYEIDTDSSDIQIYKSAYQAMQNRLKDAWEGRQDGLPYKTPYEMLIMASLIEKETAHEEDRRPRRPAADADCLAGQGGAGSGGASFGGKISVFRVQNGRYWPEPVQPHAERTQRRRQKIYFEEIRCSYKTLRFSVNKGRLKTYNLRFQTALHIYIL